MRIHIFASSPLQILLAYLHTEASSSNDVVKYKITIPSELDKLQIAKTVERLQISYELSVEPTPIMWVRSIVVATIRNCLRQKSGLVVVGSLAHLTEYQYLAISSLCPRSVIVVDDGVLGYQYLSGLTEFRNLAYNARPVLKTGSILSVLYYLLKKGIACVHDFNLWSLRERFVFSTLFYNELTYKTTVLGKASIKDVSLGPLRRMGLSDSLFGYPVTSPMAIIISSGLVSCEWIEECTLRKILKTILSSAEVTGKRVDYLPHRRELECERTVAKTLGLNVIESERPALELELMELEPNLQSQVSIYALGSTSAFVLNVLFRKKLIFLEDITLCLPQKQSFLSVEALDWRNAILGLSYSFGLPCKEL